MNAELERLQQLLRLVVEWQDQAEASGPNYFDGSVFVPNNKELDKSLRGRTGACARQLLRVLAGAD
jgi:hypothetical protein